MLPSLTINDLSHLTPVNAERISYGLMRLPRSRSLPNNPHKRGVELGVVVRFAFGCGPINARPRAKCVTRLIPLFQESLSASWACLLRQRRLVAVISRRMKRSVRRASHQLQVLKAVVGLIAVLVMNVFKGQERSPNVLAHHKAMESNIPAFAGVRMVRSEDFDIAAALPYATGPIAVINSTRSMSWEITGCFASVVPITDALRWHKGSAASAITSNTIAGK